MKSESFSIPQRQSPIGILLIFLTTVFKFLRGFWVLGVYFLFNNPAGYMLFLTMGGLSVAGILTLAYSYIYYRKFVFYIDFQKEEFKLEKGVFSTENIAVPFDKIQQVYFKRSILQRIINVYSLVIETAGSSEAEIDIKAISKGNANELLQILTRVKSTARNGVGEQKESESSEVLWTHQLDILDLLKIGISTNYLRGLALILIFFSTIYNEFQVFWKDYSEDWSSQLEQIPSAWDSLGFLTILGLGILVLSMALTIIEVFIKYFGLKLQQSNNKLELEMGLKTNTKVSLQPNRIQFMEISTNPVQKRLNLYQAQIFLASSENSLKRSKIKIPGLGSEIVTKIKSFIYPESQTQVLETFKPHKLILGRQIFFGVLVPVGLSALFPYFTDLISYRIWSILAIIAFFLLLLFQWEIYQSRKLILLKDFLQLKSGVWNREERTIETYKLQALTVSQPFWYKKRKVVNVKFHSAGGDVTFRAVTKDIIPYLNYVLFRIESTRRKWM